MERDELRFTGLDLSPNHFGMVTIDIDGNTTALHYVAGTSKAAKLAAPDERATAFVYKHPTAKQEPDTHLKEMRRLSIMRGQLLDQLDRHQTTHLAIEGYAFQAVGREYQIGELGGIAKADLWEMDIPFRIHDPTAVKMFVAHNGHASKEDVIEAVTRRWRQEFWMFSTGAKSDTVEEDLSDAYGLAQMARTEWRLRAGEMNMTGLHPKEVAVFMRTTKANPLNVLGRQWTSRDSGRTDY